MIGAAINTEDLGSNAVPAPALDQVTEIAFTKGLAAALASLPLARETPSSSTFGWTLVPAGSTDALPAHLPPDPLPVAGRVAALEGLTLVRAERAPEPARAGPAELPFILLALRVGLTRRMLGLAIEHLRGRMSDGRPLVQRQMVQDNVAEVAAALEICTSAITAAAGPAVGARSTEWMHDRLDRADNLVVGMFGAAGFLLDHPVRCLHVVALLRDLWDPGGQGDPPC